MKTFLLCLGLLPLLSFSQDCSIKTEIDPFSQQSRLSTGFIGLTNARLSVTADAKEFDFFFALSGGKCFDDATSLTILYDDGRTKSLMRSSGSMNCEGLFHFTLRNTVTSNSNLTRLETKKARSFMFTNGKEITTILLNEAQQTLFQNAIQCISKAGKTLLPK